MTQNARICSDREERFLSRANIQFETRFAQVEQSRGIIGTTNATKTSKRYAKRDETRERDVSSPLKREDKIPFDTWPIFRVIFPR